MAWLIEKLPQDDVGPPYLEPNPECWQLSPDALEQHEDMLAAAPDDRQSLLTALHLLDEWHQPVGPQGMDLSSPDGVHQWVRDLALHIGLNGQLNPPGGSFAVIPAGAPGSRRRRVANSAYPGAAIINWLNHVTLVPAMVSRSPLVDAEKRRPTWRGEPPDKLRFRYHRLTTYASPLPTDKMVIGVAPLLADKGDATLTSLCHGEDRCYAVRHHYKPESVNSILDQAREKQVDMLLFPEMALNLDSLNCVKKWLSRNEGHGIKLVSAGLLRPDPAAAARKEDLSRNEVVHLDPLGDEILVQHKLSPWDMNFADARKLGVQDALGITEADIALENIRFGGDIHLVDLPGLGRLMALICADINDDDPMDRLIGAARVDWLHAPIMDHSTCWQIEARTPGVDLSRRWSIGRARRAASAGCRFIVTNSAVLTSMANCINRTTDAGKKYVLEEVGVCYLCDGLDDTFRHRNVRRRTWNKPVLDIILWPDMLEDDWASRS